MLDGARESEWQGPLSLNIQFSYIEIDDWRKLIFKNGELFLACNLE